jgi:catechol 2,3-dioxygenase-like lactoylglutathione lyase family enzyme
MNAHQVLATVAVSDFAASSAWYARLFGRAPDHRPNASCAEWQIAKRTWIQLLSRTSTDTGTRLDSSSVGIIVDNLDEVLTDLHGRHIDVSPQAATHFVRFAPVSDPDGNMVTFVESVAA